jgi:predicted dehydrogenase
MKRREFLKASAIAATGLGLSSLASRSIFGANSPSNRINVGFIGLGNQSTVDLPAFLQQPDVQVVAVCDVNKASHGYRDPNQFLGREPGKKRVEDYYAKQRKSDSYSGCKMYTDFRELLANKEIDAVVLILPDHWHAIAAIMAAQAGKDIYGEKPLSLTLQEGQEMVKAVREHKRIFQTGSQYRSSPQNRLCCELVRNGRIGQLKRILTEVPGNNAVNPGPNWKPEPVPEGFDYEMWLGPAPQAAYHHDRCLYRFRFVLDYSGGQTTNTGAHCLDIAQWGHGSDQTGPVEFEDMGSEWPEPGSLHNVATTVSFRARYADGVELVCTKTKRGFATRFEGTEGWVEYDARGLHTSNESLKTSAIGPNEIHLPRSVEGRADNDPSFRRYLNPDHARNFIDAVKSRKDPINPIEVGHRTCSICHLGNIAMRLKRKIQWDPQTEQIIGDDEAKAMLSRPMRSPWHI